ncbi:MAG: hypothetical protein GY950_09005, partial [bacterium]|nr:hypothetical protein [bacterium]
KGNFWFGTTEGVSKFDGKKFENITPGGGLAGKVVRTIIEDRAGNMWFGTKGGLSRFDGKNITNFTVKDGLSGNEISTVMEDSQGIIRIGTVNGICNYDGETFTDISKKYGIKQKNIYSIVQGPGGSVWFIAYGDGIVALYPDHTHRVFSSKDGLNNDNVVSLCFDDGGKLWLGTEKGICRFDVETYEKTGRKIFKHYGEEEGFVGIECIHNAIFKDTGGNTWFGTIKGALKYNPARDKSNFLEPLTHITGLHLLFEENTLPAYANGISPGIGLPIDLGLPYDKNYLVFDFIGLNFTVPGKVKYQYMLKGFDNRWVPGSKDSHANYPNLPPGGYTFMVKACNEDGVWNKVPTMYHFEITPPFWETWWFYSVCAVFIILSISVFIKIRTRHLE